MPARHRTNPGWHLAMLALLLIAFGLRLWRLEAQSLWADEGTSVALAPRALLRIAEDASHDIHPPLYYLLLHFWVGATGTTIFAVRTLSVVLGTALVAATATLARRWFGPGAGLLAAVAATVSPFAIHYSQEARMYIQVALLGAISWYALDRALRVPSARRWALYWLPTLALMYSHYYSLSLLVAQTLTWALRQWGRWRQGRLHLSELGRWVAIQGSLGLAFLPWLWYSRETILNWPAISPPVTLPLIVGDTARIWSLGPATEPGWSPWLLGFGALLLLGLVGQRLVRPAGGLPPGASALLYMLVPPGLMVILSALDRPFYNPKFLLLALPGAHLVLGAAAVPLAAAARRLQRHPLAGVAVGAAALFLALAAVGPLRNEFFNPRYWRDDYRGIARTIEGLAGPDDAILLAGPGQIEIFDYFYRGTLPRYPMPRQQPLDPEATIAELEALAERHTTLYALLWAQRESDPEGIIEAWLADHAFPAGRRWFGNVQLATFRFADPPLRPVGARFGAGPAPALTLDTAGWAPAEVAAGEVLALVGDWTRGEAVPPRLTFFAQLLDPANNVVAQYDGEAGLPPLDAWPAGTTARARLGLPVRPGTFPGDYRLIVGSYEPETGSRLPLGSGGDALELGQLRVTRPPVPPPIEALDIVQPLALPLGEATLLGSRVHALGADSQPERPLRPGGPLAVILFWEATTDGPSLPALRLTLEGMGTTWPLDVGGGRHPPARWQASERVRDPAVFFLPADLPAGRYRLLLGAADRSPISIGEIAVQP